MLLYPSNLPAPPPCRQVTDPMRASYGVDNPLYALSQLAQTTMRSELGKISLDESFKGREVSGTGGGRHAWVP